MRATPDRPFRPDLQAVARSDARAPRPRRAAHRITALIVCAALLALFLPGAAAAQQQDDGEVSTFFVGIGAGICTLVYTPLKVVYAISALPMSGLVYLWSVGDTEMAGRVMRSGTQGTYVVTPKQLRGQEPIHFVGPANEGENPDEKKQQNQW